MAKMSHSNSPGDYPQAGGREVCPECQSELLVGSPVRCRGCGEKAIRIADLEAALREATSQIAHGRLGSIGSLESHYCPQIRVADLNRWRALLSPQEDEQEK